MALNVILFAAMVGVVGLGIREGIAYARRRAGYGLRRLTLRLSMSVMLLYLLGSIYLGLRVFHLEYPGAFPGHWMVFWACVLLLTVAILCLAMADLRSFSDESGQEAAKILQEINDTIATHQSRKSKSS